MAALVDAAADAILPCDEPGVIREANHAAGRLFGHRRDDLVGQSLAQLLPAVRRRFEGLGAPDQIEVRISENGSEYLVLDRRYGILYHPWLRVGEAAPEDIQQREINRLPLLKRKMIEDLEEGVVAITTADQANRYSEHLVLRTEFKLQLAKERRVKFIGLALCGPPRV